MPKNKAAQALGRLGGLKGGKASTPAQNAARAQNAEKARLRLKQKRKATWDNWPPDNVAKSTPQREVCTRCDNPFTLPPIVLNTEDLFCPDCRELLYT